MIRRSDYIDRQAAIDALEREKTYCTAFRDGYTPINVFEKYNAGLSDGIKALKNLPSAEERKCGNWVGIVDGPCGTIECDVCGFALDIWIEGAFYNFCPNCGADMRGGKDG